MSSFSPITEADLARARADPAFRQKLLAQSLDALLAGITKLRSQTSNRKGGGAKQLREGVELAVRLAEIIQSSSYIGGVPNGDPNSPPGRRS
jgi:hypothetical protein